MEGPSEASIKERNEKIENLWKRSFEGRTMFNDLPRFAQTIQVFGGTGDQLLHAPKAGAGAVKNLKDLFTVLTHELEGSALAERVARTFDEEFKGPEDVQNKAHFVKYLTDIYGGEESRVVRLLQACNQSVPSPAIIELQKALITKSGQAGMTKDVKDSWIFHIHLPPPHAPEAADSPKGRPGAVVRVEKREQHIMNMFQYQWQLLIHFDEAVQTVRSISLRVIDLMYHQNLHAALPLKLGLVAILSPYLAPNVAQLAETREWEFFKVEGPTAAAAEEKSLLVINDADNADSDFESSRTDAKAKNPRREGSPLSNSGKEQQEASRRKAIVTYPNGDHYEGTLKGQLRDGEGVYTTLRGDVYMGEYHLGKKHGKGTYTMKDGTRYEGDFKDGKPNGKGMYVWANGDVYTGEFENDEFHGHGSWSSASGEHYEGEFVHGKRHGWGTFKSSSGHRYEGQWFNDSRQGKGKYYFATGEMYEGPFMQNNFDGSGVYTYANGDRVEGIFKAGQLTEIVTLHQVGASEDAEAENESED